jgi:hypothetical protein
MDPALDLFAQENLWQLMAFPTANLWFWHILVGFCAVIRDLDLFP